MIKPVFLKTALIFACFILASCSESNISSDVSGTVSEVGMTLNNTNNIVSPSIINQTISDVFSVCSE